MAQIRASRIAYFVAPSSSFGQIKYFMTRVYWVTHEEPYHQMTSKLRFEFALLSLSAPFRDCLICLSPWMGINGPIKGGNTRCILLLINEIEIIF